MNLQRAIDKQSISFKKTVWHILQIIEKGLNKSSNNIITFYILDSESAPSHEHQRDTLTFLKNMRAITTRKNIYSKYPIVHVYYLFENILGNANNLPLAYVIEVHKEKFIELYDLYRKLYEKYDYSYFDEITGTLNVIGKKIRFTTKSQSFYLLAILLNSNDRLYSPGDPIDLREINEMISSITNEPISLSKRAFYSVSTNINERVLKKTGRKDFLLIKDECIRINETYLPPER